MLGFFKNRTEKTKHTEPETANATIVFSIDGMHCISCALNIDGTLEDATGVFSASTNYARAQAKITFDPEKITEEKLESLIESLGYRVIPTGK